MKWDTIIYALSFIIKTFVEDKKLASPNAHFISTFFFLKLGCIPGVQQFEPGTEKSLLLFSAQKHIRMIYLKYGTFSMFFYLLPVSLSVTCIIMVFIYT